MKNNRALHIEETEPKPRALDHIIISSFQVCMESSTVTQNRYSILQLVEINITITTSMHLYAYISLPPPPLTLHVYKISSIKSEIHIEISFIKFQDPPWRRISFGGYLTRTWPPKIEPPPIRYRCLLAASTGTCTFEFCIQWAQLRRSNYMQGPIHPWT